MIKVRCAFCEKIIKDGERKAYEYGKPICRTCRKGKDNRDKQHVVECRDPFEPKTK